jgi:hypothetical protein
LFSSKYHRNRESGRCAFKTTGKGNLKGWRVVLKPNAKEKEADPTLLKAKRSAPTLLLEKKLKHQISLQRRPYYAMETAGKQVDDEDLRELMKENELDVRREQILLKRF